MSSEKKFYITTPIYYGTAKPHIGSLYSTLIADVLARWHMIKGEKTFFLTGTDEHGQKVAQEAQKVGKDPKVFVDHCVEAYKSTWKTYGIDYSYFIRTTDPDHIKSVQSWIMQLQAKGEIYKGSYAGWYCTPCETYVNDLAPDAKDPHCPTCQRPVHYVEEESYFFKLSAYQQRLLDFYKANPTFITPCERMQEIISFVSQGLKDLSISRTTLSWGIPFPGDDKHVVYVWADALNNYISAIGYGDPSRAATFNQWWPADVQVLGKDIVRFHAVYWPAFLMAADLALPKNLLVHGWIKVGDQKMSKSLGNVIDPDHLAEQYGAEVVRYYLMRYIAITQDSPFSVEDMENRINADLVNDLGNLLNRMLVLAHKNNSTVLPRVHTWSQAALDLRDQWWTTLEEFIALCDEGSVYLALAHLWKFIHQINSYFHAQEPWKKCNTNPALFLEILSATAHALYNVAVLLWPVMPLKSRLIMQALGQSMDAHHGLIEELKTANWNKSFILMMINPLFTKIERAPVSADQASSTATNVTTAEDTKEDISIGDFAKVDLRIGLIKQCEEVAKSDKLLKLIVDFGSIGERQILSGIKKLYKPQELLGKKAVFVTNLAPRTMMGLESHGMLLLAQDEHGNSSIIGCMSEVQQGALIK